MGKTDPNTLPAWARPFRRTADSPLFNNIMTGVIVAASVLVGIQTYQGVPDHWREVMSALDSVIIGVFVIELIVRMLAYGYRPWRFFGNGWNVFDFIVVVACLIPASKGFGVVLRLARVLRTMRLFSAVPRLQVMVTALIKSVPSIGYVGLLLFLHFYVYAVVGTTLFGRNDPHHFGSLHASLLSLFRIMTMEDWTDIMYMQIYGTSQGAADGMYNYEWQEAMLTPEQRDSWTPKPQPVVAVVYFLTFVGVATYIILNLFVGVVLGGMDEAQKEQAAAKLIRTDGAKTVEHKLRAMEGKVDTLLEDIAELRRAIAQIDRLPPPPTDTPGNTTSEQEPS